MTIQLLAHDLASRVPAMAQDSPINNAYMIEKMIEACFTEYLVDQATRIAKWDQERCVAAGGISFGGYACLQPVPKPWNQESYDKLTRDGQSLEQPTPPKGTGGCYCSCLPCQSCDHR